MATITKLYPPKINTTIPAFYRALDGTTTLVVPFSMNKDVSMEDVYGFSLVFKNSNNKVKDILMTIDYSVDDNTARFKLTDDFLSTLSVGVFYKIQLAYINQNELIGYYSNVGVVKYTTQPTVSIQGLISPGENIHVYTYTGLYSQEKASQDSTEKLYSSYWELREGNETIVYTTEEKLHNIAEDMTSYAGYETVEIYQELDADKTYHLRFVTMSIHGIKQASPWYLIRSHTIVAPEINVELTATQNYIDGTVKLKMHSLDSRPLTGSIVLSRCSDAGNYKDWVQIKKWHLYTISADLWSYEDFTVEHGRTYIYGIQQYNDYNVYSSYIRSNAVTIGFEDYYLYDGEKQLRVQYNPKISTFKNNIQEQKVDTIGNRYPFFFRNGNVHYKEFALSGLLSYQMDENEKFISKGELFFNDFSLIRDENDELRYINQRQDLTDLNIQTERLFKLAVMEWLNDGKIKFLRTPTEGNYLVRIMNVTMSPIDSLGRMLHTFNCTAYEADDITFERLNHYGIIHTDDEDTKQMLYTTVLFGDTMRVGQGLWAAQHYTAEQKAHIQDQPIWLVNNPIHKVSYISFHDIRSDTPVYIHFGNLEGTTYKDSTNNLLTLEDDGYQQTILIGATGSFTYYFKEPVSRVYITPTEIGTAEYGYYSTPISSFSLIKDATVESVVCRQFIGDDYTGRVWGDIDT